MRRRLTLLSGLAVAVTVVIASAIAYFAVAHQLRDEVDDSLRGAGRVAVRFSEGDPGDRKAFERRLLLQRALPAPVPGQPQDSSRPDVLKGADPGEERIPLGGPRQSAQIVTAAGQVLGPPGIAGALPPKALFREVAAGEKPATFTDVDVEGDHLRVYAQPVGDGLAFVSARSVEEIDDVLGQLRLLLLFVVIGGTLLAALMGRAVATASIAPITRLEEGARHVAETNDLTRRIDVDGPDETRTLAIQFNTMLEALEGSAAALGASVESQRRLIADTSHELRTPITSLRTNIEVLHAVDRLSDRERTELLNEVEGELEELGALIEDVIELARGDEPGAAAMEPEPVRLDTLVADVADRVGRHWPEVDFKIDAEEARIQGAPDRVGRAVRNLLDNAAKWSPPGGAVDVTVRDGEITVRDHGSGIPDDELERIFDRFYRAPGNGDRPGSGLGLAIARQVAEAHGGSVTAENADGGGALFRLRLPG
jgi:two-component system sensor histidine kinase MprB